MTTVVLLLGLLITPCRATELVGEWSVDVKLTTSSCLVGAPHWVGDETRWAEHWWIATVGGAHPAGSLSLVVERGAAPIRFEGTRAGSGMMVRAPHRCEKEGTDAAAVATYDVEAAPDGSLTGTLVVAYVAHDRGAAVACARVFDIRARR